MALVGESGSGKSITSLSIMRLLPIPPGEITAGTIKLNGKNLLDYKSKEMSHIRGNEIGMIFQEPMTSLDPVFTIGNQMIEAIRRHQKVSKKRSMDTITKALTRSRHCQCRKDYCRVSASAFRWHAATCHDCDGDVQ